MTPAEFDTRRRLIGLSIDETAVLCGLTRPRALQRWLDSDSIPQDACEAILNMQAKIAHAIEEALSAAYAANIHHVTLYRYRTQADMTMSVHAHDMPLGAHAVMIGQLAEALRAEGFCVEIEWG